MAKLTSKQLHLLSELVVLELVLLGLFASFFVKFVPESIDLLIFTLANPLDHLFRFIHLHPQILHQSPIVLLVSIIILLAIFHQLLERTILLTEHSSLSFTRLSNFVFTL